MKISFVLPAFNEADNIYQTVDEIRQNISTIEDLESFEVIIVDDCSNDNTYDEICSLNNKDNQIRGIRLSRRSGSHVALRAGIDASVGDAVICMSADGQDNPGAIGNIIAKWQEGYEVVWALRKKRENEPLHVKLLVELFYKLLSWFGDVKTEIDLSRADFYLLDRSVVDAVKACNERNTSLFGLIAWLGFVQGSIDYDRRERRSGQSKWNFSSKINLAKNWIIAFSGLPLKIITPAGFLIALSGFVYALFLISRWLVLGSPLIGWPSIMTAILLLGGVQMIMLGIIGEYLWRTLDESRNRPNYFIEKDTHSHTIVPSFSRRRMDME